MEPKYKVGRKSRSKKILKVGLIIVLFVGVYFLGFNVGSGKISISHKLDNQNNNLPTRLDYSSVNQVYSSLKNNYYKSLNENQLLDGLKHGLAESTNDPYTEYFTAKEAKAFSNELNNTFSGIGAELGKDKNDNIEIISPIKGFPADQAGIKAGDLVATINGESTNGMSVDKAVTKIRGKAGAKVTLQIVRGNNALKFTITRANINVPSINNKIMSGNIGYMQITTFSEDTDKLADAAAKSFTDAHVKGIILDLRNNPGGLLDDSVHVSSFWLNSGAKILDEKRGNETLQTYSANNNNPLKGIPTVVLINEGSASASEITTGALHDNHVAYVIGQKSYGKGVVQNLICISGERNSDGTCPGDELKVTIASWFRPDGENINHKGITPDKIVTINTGATPDNDSQINTAIDYLNKHQ